MEHPSVNVVNLKDEFTIEQIQEKISQLRSRLNFAYGMGKQEVINQIQMVLECYERAQIEMLNEIFSGDDDDDDPTDNIRISSFRPRK